MTNFRHEFVISEALKILLLKKILPSFQAIIMIAPCDTIRKAKYEQE